MKYYLTKEEMDRLENLAEMALSANNKKEAEKYIQNMNFAIRDVWGPSGNILNEMISAVNNATGRISNKTRNLDIARQLIIKARMFCVKEGSSL